MFCATTRIWWVRHGPTHQAGMVGWSDVPADLSDVGALDRLAKFLPGGVPILSSDLSRAVETARCLSRGHPVLPAEKDLREIHFGDWELRRHAEVEAEDPDRIRAFWEDPASIRPPGGETWTEMSGRVAAVVDRLRATHPELVIVAHFGVILAELQRCLGWRGEQAFAQRIDPLSLTRIDYGPNPVAPVINHHP